MEQYHIFAQNVTNIQSRINALSDPEGPRAIAKAQSIAHKKYTHTNKNQPKANPQRTQSRTHAYTNNTNTLQTIQPVQHRHSYSKIAATKPSTNLHSGHTTQNPPNHMVSGARSYQLPHSTPKSNTNVGHQGTTTSPKLTTKRKRSTNGRHYCQHPTLHQTINDHTMQPQLPKKSHTKAQTPAHKPTITPLMEMVIPTPPRYKNQKQHSRQPKPSKAINTTKHASPQPPLTLQTNKHHKTRQPTTP